MNLSRQWLQLFRFFGAGGVGVALYYALLYTLTDWVGIWYMASAVIGRTMSFSLTFVIHKTWTFEDRSGRSLQNQMALYLTMGIGVFVANMAMLYALVEYAGVWYITAQIIASVTLTIIAYFCSRKIFTN